MLKRSLEQPIRKLEALITLLLLAATLSVTVAIARREFDDGDPRIASTTKVDNLVIAGATTATGLVTATAGVNGGTLYATTPDVGEPGFRSVRNSTAPGPTTNAQWRFGYSSATTDMIWKYYNGVSTSGPWMTLSTAGNLTLPGLIQGDSLVISNDAEVSGKITLGPANTTTIRSDAGSPEGVVAANIGSLFTRTNGAALTTLYVKEGGVGSTGWKAYANTDAFTSVTAGLSPASGGGTANFLRADGTWNAPPGTATGTVTSISQGTGLSFTSNPITTTGTITLNMAGASCSAGEAVTAITSTGTGSCSAFATASNGTLTGGASSTYSGGVNLTTTGTVDWAAWDTNFINGSARQSVGGQAQQRKPHSTGAKAGRLYDGLLCECLGASSCNSGTLCTSASNGGNGVTTSTGASNNAGAALSSSTTGPNLTTGTGAAQVITIPLFPGESGTLCVYQVEVDVNADWLFTLYQDGTSQATQSGSFTNANTNLTKSEKACATFTAGAGHNSTLIYKGTLTANGGTNPHLYIMGAEIH